MRLLNRLFAVAALLGCAAVVAAPQGAVQVRLSAPAPVLSGDVDVSVTVSVTNTTRHPVQVLRWQLPQEDNENALFRISTESGAAARYLGAITKRGGPQAADFVRIDAGATVEYSVELSALYDLSANGRYAIEYRGVAGHGAHANLNSQPLYLWLQGRSAKAPEPAPVAPASASTSFASCSASQQTTLTSARTNATSYAANATSYLATASSTSQRYAKWYGAYNSSRWNTVSTNFSKIRDAFNTQAITFNCKCKKPSTYAYVYANQPYTIYLCGAFWNAPATGTDSKAGTLVHEMSHFDVVADTSDHAYGQTNASALAISDPAKAVANADNYEYFAENTPSLP